MVYVQNEYNQLKRVILGIGYNIKKKADTTLVENLPPTSDKYKNPSSEQTESELSRVKHALSQYGVTVDRPVAVDSPKLSDQTCPRDIGFVIDSLYFKAQSCFESRNIEHEGIDSLLHDIPKDQFITIPPGLFLEGGDVVLGENAIFVGLGCRSNREAIDWLSTKLKERKIDRELIIIPHKVLHLDCCWNVIDSDVALWCGEVTDNFMKYSGGTYKININTVNISLPEQKALATNVLALGKRRILARDNYFCKDINYKLRKEYDFSINTIKFDSIPSIGGSFRCATLPLFREINN